MVGRQASDCISLVLKCPMVVLFAEPAPASPISVILVDIELGLSPTSFSKCLRGRGTVEALPEAQGQAMSDVVLAWLQVFPEGGIRDVTRPLLSLLCLPHRWRESLRRARARLHPKR